MSNLRQQILARSLPPVVPSASRKVSSNTRNYTPISWNSYFDEKRHITIDDNTFCVYTRRSVNCTEPVLFFLHGGGFSGLSWAVLSKAMTSLIRCQCIAMDIRGHGETKVTDETDLRMDILAKDVRQVLQHLFNNDADRPAIFLIGHSMGRGQRCVASLT
jgi:protein phosphatase methylesterase 1